MRKNTDFDFLDDEIFLLTDQKNSVNYRHVPNGRKKQIPIIL